MGLPPSERMDSERLDLILRSNGAHLLLEKPHDMMKKRTPFVSPNPRPFRSHISLRGERKRRRIKRKVKKGRKRFVISLPLYRSRPSHRWFRSYAMKSAILAKMRPSRCETCTQNPQNRRGARETGGTTLKNEERLDRTGFRMKESNEI